MLLLFSLDSDLVVVFSIIKQQLRLEWTGLTAWYSAESRTKTEILRLKSNQVMILTSDCLSMLCSLMTKLRKMFTLYFL